MTVLVEIFLLIVRELLKEMPVADVHKLIDDADVDAAHAEHAAADDAKFGPAPETNPATPISKASR